MIFVSIVGSLCRSSSCRPYNFFWASDMYVACAFLKKKLTQIGLNWQCSLSNFSPLFMGDRFCSACLFSELFLCCRSKNFLVRFCVVGLLFDLIKSLDCLSNYEATKEFLQDPICCFPPNKGGKFAIYVSEILVTKRNRRT